MGLRLTYLLRNTTRNPLRAALTCAAVGLPVMILVLSAAVIDGVERFLDNSAKQLRLAVGSKTSMVNPLPVGYRAKIESLDPERRQVLAVCGITWIGGKIEGDSRPLSTLCIDQDTFPVAFPEFQLTPEEMDAWVRDRQAIVVGEATAQQFGWKVGDRITIHPSVPPYVPMQFNIIADSRRAVDKITNWARRDYLAEVRTQAGYPGNWVSFFFVKCTGQAAMNALRIEIDELFRGTPDETFTQDEKAFMAQFITQQFDLPTNLTWLAVVTIGVAVLAAANTMSMNFRDRLSEFATLKALGFPSGPICGLIALESVLLCALGGALGAGVPYIAFTHTPLRNLTVPLIQYLEIRPEVCLFSLLIAAGVGLLAGAWPAWLGLRLKVIAALRTLE